VWANIASQLASNGGNWGQLDPWAVGLAGAAGFASSGLGTITASLGPLANLIANGIGSGAISDLQQVI